MHAILSDLICNDEKNETFCVVDVGESLSLKSICRSFVNDIKWRSVALLNGYRKSCTLTIYGGLSWHFYASPTDITERLSSVVKAERSSARSGGQKLRKMLPSTVTKKTFSTL